MSLYVCRGNSFHRQRELSLYVSRFFGQVSKKVGDVEDDIAIEVKGGPIYEPGSG